MDIGYYITATIIGLAFVGAWVCVATALAVLRNAMEDWQRIGKTAAKDRYHGEEWK